MSCIKKKGSRYETKRSYLHSDESGVSPICQDWVGAGLGDAMRWSWMSCSRLRTEGIDAEKTAAN